MKKTLNFTTIKHFEKEYEEISVDKKTVSVEFPLHWHDFFEIEILTGGKGTHILNGQNYCFKRGCAYLLSPTDFHQGIPDESIGIYNIKIHESVLSDEMLHVFLAANRNNICYFNEEELNRVIALCDIIYYEYNNAQKYRSEFLRGILECLLTMILRKLNFSHKSQSCNNYMQKAITYMKLHFKNNPTLMTTANEVCLNPNYFSQKFKECVGKNYSEYLSELKLSYAKKLLLSSNLTVTEICFASGFTSLSNFMKVFREREGVSPAGYAKNKRQAVTLK